MWDRCLNLITNKLTAKQKLITLSSAETKSAVLCIAIYKMHSLKIILKDFRLESKTTIVYKQSLDQLLKNYQNNTRSKNLWVKINL